MVLAAGTRTFAHSAPAGEHPHAEADPESAPPGAGPPGAEVIAIPTTAAIPTAVVKIVADRRAAIFEIVDRVGADATVTDAPVGQTAIAEAAEVVELRARKRPLAGKVPRADIATDRAVADAAIANDTAIADRAVANATVAHHPAVADSFISDHATIAETSVADAPAVSESTIGEAAVTETSVPHSTAVEATGASTTVEPPGATATIKPAPPHPAAVKAAGATTATAAVATKMSASSATSTASTAMAATATMAEGDRRRERAGDEKAGNHQAADERIEEIAEAVGEGGLHGLGSRGNGMVWVGMPVGPLIEAAHTRRGCKEKSYCRLKWSGDLSGRGLPSSVRSIDCIVQVESPVGTITCTHLATSPAALSAVVPTKRRLNDVPSVSNTPSARAPVESNTHERTLPVALSG